MPLWRLTAPRLGVLTNKVRAEDAGFNRMSKVIQANPLFSSAHFESRLALDIIRYLGSCGLALPVWLGLLQAPIDILSRNCHG